MPVFLATLTGRHYPTAPTTAATANAPSLQSAAAGGSAGAHGFVGHGGAGQSPAGPPSAKVGMSEAKSDLEKLREVTPGRILARLSISFIRISVNFSSPVTSSPKTTPRTSPCPRRTCPRRLRTTTLTPTSPVSPGTPPSTTCSGPCRSSQRPSETSYWYDVDQSILITYYVLVAKRYNFYVYVLGY